MIEFTSFCLFHLGPPDSLILDLFLLRTTLLSSGFLFFQVACRRNCRLSGSPSISWPRPAESSWRHFLATPFLPIFFVPVHSPLVFWPVPRSGVGPVRLHRSPSDLLTIPGSYADTFTRETSLFIVLNAPYLSTEPPPGPDPTSTGPGTLASSGRFFLQLLSPGLRGQFHRYSFTPGLAEGVLSLAHFLAIGDNSLCRWTTVSLP